MGRSERTVGVALHSRASSCRAGYARRGTALDVVTAVDKLIAQSQVTSDLKRRLHRASDPPVWVGGEFFYLTQDLLAPFDHSTRDGRLWATG